MAHIAEGSVTDDEMLDEFCRQLFHLGQFVNFRIFMSGSYVEIPFNSRSRGGCGVYTSAEDVDRTIYSLNRYVYPRKQRVPDSYRGLVIRIHSDNMHPGYVQLIREADYSVVRREELVSEYFILNENKVVHGPAVQEDRRTMNMKFVSGFGNQGSKPKCPIVDLVSLHDTVIAMHCPYWPVEASEWITRTRRHGCPSKSVIKQVVRYGCDFVGVAHKLSSDEEKMKQWRCSFSMAELIIIRNWNRSQRIVYRTIRLIFKMLQQKSTNVSEKCFLCTYYYKTLVLWACEEQPPEFWTDALLVDAVRRLLMKMSDWLASRYCPNYFIPGNNMMDHLVDTDVSCDFATLRYVAKTVNLIENLLRIGCESDEDFGSTIKFFAEMPTWLSRVLLILSRTNNLFDNHRGLFPAKYPERLRIASRTEMQGVYNALLILKRVTEKTIPTGFERDYLCEVECLLCNAARLCESDVIETVELQDDMDVITSLFNRHDYDIRPLKNQSSDEWHNQKFLALLESNKSNSSRFPRKKIATKHLVYSRSVQATHFIKQSPTFLLNRAKKVHLSWYIESKETSGDFLSTLYYRHLRDFSPTVNAAWFIAKAHLANLYYTFQRDYKATTETCNDIIEVFNQSLGNKCVAERALPLLVSTQWTAVYDQELQVILGFLSLGVFVSSKAERRSVNLGICPVQFAFYLKRRCARDQQQGDESKRIFEESLNHGKDCLMVEVSWAMAKYLLNFVTAIHTENICF